MELTFLKFSPDSQRHALILRRWLNSLTMSISDTSLLVQPTLVPPSELQSTFTFQILDFIKKNSRPLLISTLSRSEELMESILRVMTTSTTSLTREDLADQR